MKKVRANERLLAIFLSLMLVLSVCAVPTFAEEGGAVEEPAAITAGIVNTSGDGGSDAISLSASRTFKAYVPVEMTEAEAAEAAKNVTWSMVRDSSKSYADAAQYPNQIKGGVLESWLCSDDKTALFTDVVSGAETVGDKVYLTVTFKNNIYFYKDGQPYIGVPHSNGGTYIDVSGYFNLTAESSDGNALGSVPVTIRPYDKFHTMSEIYSEIDNMVKYADTNTDLYVEKFSMGKSQGDNGQKALDMPYMIIAKNKAAVDKWKTIKDEAETNPDSLLKKIANGSLGNYQVPVMYSNVHANEVAASDGVIEFAWLLLKAAAEDGEIAYDKLVDFTEEGRAELEKEMGPEGQKGSVAIPDLVKDSATYLGYLHPSTDSPFSTKVDLEKYYNTEEKIVNIDELMDDVFFIIVPEENVEGRTYVTRTSSGGFDLNRDNSFQTQAETQNMTRLISEWNPVSFTEFHGRVEAFQCEPCSPPHEPNFEYDLLAEHLMAGGEALGIAAVANNDGHNSYVIPQRDYLEYTGNGNETVWGDPWDDMSTSYTPQYAMLHGTVSYTVEVPAYDDYMVTALAYGQLGQSDYIAANKDSYLTAQTKIYQRGVNNANSNKEVNPWFCDQNDIEGGEADLFRPTYEENGNFYPECYIIPLDAENQHNLQAANDMMGWLTRNDVKVQLTESEFTYGGVTYPAGTMIVPMYQAKRSVANGALYDGTVITDWSQLYSEGITAFNKTRGFDMITCADADAYKEISAVCGKMMDYSDYENHAKNVKSAFSGTADAQVIIVNASEDSTAAVNNLLKNGKSVSFITEGDYKGSFLCDYAAWNSISSKYVVTGIGVDAANAPAAKKMDKAPVVYIAGKAADNTSGFVKASLVSGSYQYNYDRQALELMEFAVTEDPAKADLIIGAAALDDKAMAAVKSGTPYIGYGRNAMPTAVKLFADGSITYNSVSAGMDALSYVTYPEETMVNASYIAEKDNILYGYGTSFFSKIPEGAKVLVKLDSSKGLLEGFLPKTDNNYNAFMNDSVQAISYEGTGANGAKLDVVLFANTLTNKVHQRDEFNFISNAAFDAVTDDTSAPAVKTYVDVPENAWFAEAVAAVTKAGVMNGVSDDSFAPKANLQRAMLAQILYNMAGKPAVTADAAFTDVPDNAWYSDAVKWASANGIVTGFENGTFEPMTDITREQLATMLWRYAGKPETSGSIDAFSDASSAREYAVAALSWNVEKAIMNGYAEDNTIRPRNTATRAEAAQMMSKYMVIAE